ncbi:MAG: AMP-binding protein [Actinomycetota bacterium]
MNLADHLRFWIERRPDHPALVDDHGSLDYRGLLGAIDRTVAGLASAGVGREDRVGCLGTTRADVFVTLFACARLGASLVPINLRLADAEIDWILDDCAVSVIVGDEGQLRRLGHRSEPRCSFDDDTWRGDAGDVPATGAVDDALLVVYTSGTTGRPKGAVLTQAALLANAENADGMFDLTPADVTLVCLPLFHVGGLNITATPTLLAGGTVRCHGAFDPGRWLADVEAHRPTTSILVPAMMAAVVGHPGFDATNLSSLRYLATGSSEVPEPLLRAFLDRGVPIGQVYGLTETAPIAVHQRAEEVFERVGSTGRAARRCAVRIVSPDGEELPPGEEGEVQLAGPNLFDRYWNDAEATAEALDDGWFCTGDMGVLDDDGELTIRGRIKEMIISGGENVYPAEVERVLLDDERVAEVAVVGRSDERWGEVPVAVVVLRPGAGASEEELLAPFAGQLARFKRPAAIVFVDELPRNAMGKLQKVELRRTISR